MKRWIAALCAAALLLAACGDSGVPESSTTAPMPDTTGPVELPTTTEPVAAFPASPWPTVEWPRSTPEEQGMDSGRLADLVEKVAATSGIDSVLLVRNGYVVLDAVVYPFGPDDPHAVYSDTKSVVATLIGIAIDSGLLAGVDVPVVDLLSGHIPEVVEDRKAAMTVADLLTMSTGLDCRDSYIYNWRGLQEMQESDDWAAHVLALPMRAEPGTRFEYCNGSSFLLSAILSEVTGMAASEYAQEVLFGPLGIGAFEWPANPDGITLGWSELWLHPADMARIGYLYLRDGEWDGIQLVAAEWIEAATTEHISSGALADGYGYQWWVSDAGYYMAIGYGGQYIIVVPEQQLVIVVTSGLPLSRAGLPEELATGYVMPAVTSATPLPANPDAQARLANALEEVAAGPEPVPVILPELHSTMDGARYAFVADDLGGAQIGLRFAGDAAFLQLEEDGEALDLPIGLDGPFSVGDPVPLALRGSWTSDDTFVIEFQVVGDIQRGVFRFQFSGETASVIYTESSSGAFGRVTAPRVG